MPKHYAIDVNVLGGTVHFEGVKTVDILFLGPGGEQVLFSKAPRIVLTMLNLSSSTPFKVKNLKSGALYSGITIGFQSAVTCDVEWQAFER